MKSRVVLLSLLSLVCLLAAVTFVESAFAVPASTVSAAAPVSTVSAATVPASAVPASAASTVSTFAGTGVKGNAGDGGPADKAQLNNVFGVVRGPDGALYLCDTDNHTIRRVDKSGVLTTVAGNGTKGYSGDGGPATKAQLNEPYEVRFDAAGNLVFVERLNHLVRKVDAKTGVISTIAGTGKPGFGGDGGPATSAAFNQPHSIQFDKAGNLYVCDISNNRVRKIDPAGVVTTFAGTGEKAATPDGGKFATAPLRGPRALDFDSNGDIYLALREGNALYKLDLKAGTIHHVAGTGKSGFTGNGGPAKSATLAGPKGVSIAPDGNVYLADTESHSIRYVDLKTGKLELLAGTGAKGDGPDGDPLTCKLARPHGVFVDTDGAVYIGDSENHRVRVVRPAGNAGNPGNAGHQPGSSPAAGLVPGVPGRGVDATELLVDSKTPIDPKDGGEKSAEKKDAKKSGEDKPAVDQPATKPTSAVLTAEHPETKEQLTCTVYFDEAPDVEKWATDAGKYALKVYPTIEKTLHSEGFKPMRSFKIYFKKMDGVAHAVGDRINVSAEWIRRNPDDWGMIAHELTHLIQRYRGRPDGWLTEGIADYVRYYVIEPGSRRARFDVNRQTYKNAYQPAAGFLNWVETTKGPGIIAKLNQACREGKYDKTTFEKVAGGTADALWEEFKKSVNEKKANEKKEAEKK